jgi:hypothetical protein
VSASPVRLGIVPTLVSKKNKKRGLLCSCSVALLFVTRLCRFHTNKNITEGKKTLLTPLFLFAFAIAHRCCSCALAVTMGSSSTSSGHVPVLRYLVLFNGTNYHDWIPRMHLHMCELRLWEFLTSECPARHLLRLLLSQ